MCWTRASRRARWQDLRGRYALVSDGRQRLRASESRAPARFRWPGRGSELSVPRGRQREEKQSHTQQGAREQAAGRGPSALRDGRWAME